MTSAGTLAKYRSENRWAASTLLSVIVVGAILASGYWVAWALGQDGGRGATTARVTRPVVMRTIQRVVDARLRPERLEALLGSFGSPATSEQGAALAKIQRQAGLAPKDSPAAQEPPPVDYVVDTIRSHIPQLSALLAERVNRDALQKVLPEVAERFKTAPASERTTIATEAFSEFADPKWADAIDLWTSRLQADASLAEAYKRMPAASRTLPALVKDALDAATLGEALTSRLLTDLTLETMPAEELDLAGDDLAGRLMWGIAAVLFMALSVAAISISFWQVWTIAPKAGWVMILTAILAVLLAYLVWGADDLAPGNVELLGPLLTALDTRGGTHVIDTARFLTSLAAAAIVVMLAAGAAITKSTDADLIELQADGLRSIFNAGAAMLVAGVIEVAALYAWAAAAFEGAEADALSTAALSAAGFTGALFSAALVLVYLPAISTLRQRAREAEKSDVVEQAFGKEWYQQLGRLLQAMAPLLAALPASGVLKLLE